MGRKKKDHTSDPRTQQFVELYKAGQTLLQIAEAYGLTRERVRQLITRAGIHRNLGGGALLSQQRQIDRRVKQETRYQKKFGCSREKYLQLRTLGAVHAFQVQRSGAAARGIDWKLRLIDWWRVWEESRHWSERGKNLGQYVMSRKYDARGYEVGNVYIQTSSRNSSEKMYGKWSAMVQEEAKKRGI